MNKTELYIGLDVHKETITAAVAGHMEKGSEKGSVIHIDTCAERAVCQ